MEHQAAIRRAKTARDKADEAFKNAIRAAAADGASVRELARFTKLAPSTIQKILKP